ncbi:calumenin-B [Teleopsis dalmanni]|uniref:calumenin-B n=1 Tax=Teleopsis dalmanni TaxID=139649 RepID=UPI0018CE9D6E|nr:calumenin-B [Teleopsis dalmanni]
MLRLNCLLLLLCAIIYVNAVPKPDELKQHPHEHDSANVKHFDGDTHNTQYDHEAFLGEDEAKEFDQLPPEESKRRLGVIVDRIDDNKDGLVDLSELKRWIEYTKRRYIDEDVARIWKQHNPNNNDTIDWESYRKNVYGFMEGMTKEELEHEENGISYQGMLKKDRRRWGVADQNLDDALTKEEFTAFLHPEEHKTMQDIVLMETLEDIDKNKDGKVSVDEYIGDLYRASEPSEVEPEWVVSERESFSKFRDLDGDGFLNREEVRAWVVPKDFDHAESESKHLIFEADQDGDEKLTKDEILDKYDIFVGSQATDFGEALARHDEF